MAVTLASMALATAGPVAAIPIDCAAVTPCRQNLLELSQGDSFAFGTRVEFRDWKIDLGHPLSDLSRIFVTARESPGGSFTLDYDARGQLNALGKQFVHIIFSYTAIAPLKGSGFLTAQIGASRLDFDGNSVFPDLLLYETSFAPFGDLKIGLSRIPDENGELIETVSDDTKTFLSFSPIKPDEMRVKTTILIQNGIVDRFIQVYAVPEPRAGAIFLASVVLLLGLVAFRSRRLPRA